MNKAIFSTLILILIIPLTVSSIQAQTTDGIVLSVPPKMIVGENYEGMITLLEPSKSNQIGTISTGDDFILETQNNLKISINENHGIFTITPLHEGETIISVLYDGKFLESYTKVYSKTSDAQKLKIILPTNSTIAIDMKGFVFLLDGNDSPIESKFDRIISLVPSEKIYTPTNVVIRNSSSHAIFNVEVKATGEITAIAPQLKSHTVLIEKSQQTIDVKIGIAPNIILEGSYTNYFVWLEKDGKPYTIHDVQKVEIQSSNTDVVRLGLTPNSHKDENIMSVSMYEGIAKGRLYTGEKGISEISVSIPNYGHASTIIYVGSTLLENDDDDSTTDDTIFGNNYLVDEEYDNLDINNIQFWIYPNITSNFAYGVASLYHAEQTEEISVSVDDDLQISNIITQTVLVPVMTEDVLISISSQSGITYDSSYQVYDPHFPTHSKVFKINGNSVGDYTITATGGNSFDSANLLVTTDYKSQYFIKITELPILSQLSQPLLIISIVDSNDNLIDVSGLSTSLFTVNVHSTDIRISSSSIIFDDNVGIVSGLLTGSGEIIVSSDIFGTTSKTLTPSGFGTSIELFIPSEIHSGESFPVVIHEIDSKGIPILKKHLNEISSSGFDSFDNDRGIINGQDTKNISILSKFGGGLQTFVNSFLNKISFSLDIDNDSPRLGETITIKIESPLDDVTYDIDSPFPYVKIDETTFQIIPDYEIKDATITIIDNLDGFGVMHKTISLSPVNLVELDINVKTTNGDFISPTFEMQISENIITHNTPYRETISPQSVILTFPKDWKSFESGYKISEILQNGKVVDGNVVKFYAGIDNTIIVLYEKFIKVTIIDGVGSGVYLEGEHVLVSAPDKPIISILVKDTFDYWEGTDKTSSSFLLIADSDYTITAMYREDPRGLMIVIVLIVLGITFVIYRKGDSKIRYYIVDFIDYLKSKIKLPTINIPKVHK